MACDHFAPGQQQHLLQDRLGNPGQVIAHLHQRQGTGNLGGRDTQHVGALEVAQGFHLLFKVILGDTQQMLTQLVSQLISFRRPVQAPGIEQLIQHHRIAGNLLGNPRTGRTEHQQLAQSARVFRQQHQIGRAPGHRLDQRQHAFQRQVRVVLLGGHRQQARHENIQALSPGTLHGLQAWRPLQPLQPAPGRRCIGKAASLKLLQALRLVQRAIPDRHPVRLRRLQVGFVLIRVSDHASKVAGNTGTLGIQAGAEGFPVGKPEHPGNACLPLRLSRQHLGLAVINGLQGVLGVAQKAVGLRQLLYCRLRQIAVRAQRLQHAKNGALLQAAIAATVNQLKGLTDKLDLTNTARAQLDVVLQPLALHLTLNHLLEIAQRIDSGKVQITAIDKGPQHGQQLGASRLITRHHPRLDHRVALPVPALALVVLLQRIKAEHQRAAVTIRAQAHIHAKHKAVHRWRIQRLDQLLPQANEKLLVGQAAPPAASLAGLRVGKDQIDVR